MISFFALCLDDAVRPLLASANAGPPPDPVEGKDMGVNELTSLSRLGLGVLRPGRVVSSGRLVVLPDSAHRDAVDQSALAFAAGFNATRRGWVQDRGHLPGRVSPDLLGFAVEGAAMSAAMFDLLNPAGYGLRRRGPRLTRLAELHGDQHPYTLHCGAGWAYATLRRRPGPLSGFDPLLRWLVYDGAGFCRAFSAGPRRVTRLQPPGRWSATERAHFDQGVGRALWFLGTPAGLPDRVGGFEPARRHNLWSGIGLAAVYAGGTDIAQLIWLAERAGSFRLDLAVGVTSALQAREHGRVSSDQTRGAATALTGLPTAQLLAAHDRALAECRPLTDPYPYAGWQQRTRELLDTDAAVAV